MKLQSKVVSPDEHPGLIPKSNEDPCEWAGLWLGSNHSVPWTMRHKKQVMQILYEAEETMIHFRAWSNK